MLLKSFLFILTIFSCVSTYSQSDLIFAPPSFFSEGKKAVPVDFIDVKLDMKVDVKTEKVVSTAIVTFTTSENGYPFFDMVSNPTELNINGKLISPTMLREEIAPLGKTTFRVLDYYVPANRVNILKLAYEIPTEYDDNFSFFNNNVEIFFWLDDLTERGFWENYGPSNFEFDKFKMAIDIEIINSLTSQEVKVNGNIQNLSSNKWRVEFPSYYSTSFFYLHIHTRSYFIAKGEVEGMRRKIPIVVYSDFSQKMAEDTLNTIKRELPVLENRYGGYCHDSLLARVGWNLGNFVGPMEYGGAFLTTPDDGTIIHELTHMWFARCVTPASGNDSWIDEAIISWQGNNFPRVKPDFSNAPVNLANENSPYARITPTHSYGEGAKFMSELDFVLASKGGLLPLLSSFYKTYENKVFTTEIFKNFLEKRSGIDLNALFNRFVYGNDN